MQKIRSLLGVQKGKTHTEDTGCCRFLPPPHGLVLQNPTSTPVLFPFPVPFRLLDVLWSTLDIRCCTQFIIYIYYSLDMYIYVYILHILDKLRGKSRYGFL